MKEIIKATESIDNEYFKWLCNKVLARRGRIYYGLLKILHSTEFTWVVPADKHREADGMELRREFLRKTSYIDPDWEAQPVSILEMLIAFAERAAFQNDWPVKDWFWLFMENLQLDSFTQVTETEEAQINEILHRFIWRTYDDKGNGGLFPLAHTDNDQRQREIWYQFCEYVEERELV